jgi:outer membrane lipoprotein-sorting protein
MKKILCILVTLVLSSVSVFAQTPEEIIAQMDQVMERHEAKDGFAMVMEMKIHILGSFASAVKSWGDKMRMEIDVKGEQMITYIDGDTEWDYNVKEKVIKIKKHDVTKKSKEEENMKMFQSATEGYDVSISKETDKAWFLRCKKNRSNTNKDDPKNMDLVIAKGTYMPISLSAKVSGITITMRDLDFNVTEKDVTFNQADYPGVKVVDER